MAGVAFGDPAKLLSQLCTGHARLGDFARVMPATAQMGSPPAEGCRHAPRGRNSVKTTIVDPVTLLIATGLRRSELLGLRWTDYDHAACTLTVSGKVVRVSGEGLKRVDETKSAAGRRTVPLPRFAIEMLRNRRALPYLGQQAVIFPSTAGTLRDPNNFGKEWRKARDELGVPEVTTHSFRKTVATLIDDEGLSARIGADHLGHSKVSMTQDRYMTCGRVHTQVADLLDRTVAKSGE